MIHLNRSVGRDEVPFTGAARYIYSLENASTPSDRKVISWHLPDNFDHVLPPVTFGIIVSLGKASPTRFV